MPIDTTPKLYNGSNPLDWSPSLTIFTQLFNSITTNYPQYGTLPNNEPNVKFATELLDSPVIKMLFYNTISQAANYLDCVGSKNWPQNGSAQLIFQIYNNRGDPTATKLANNLQQYYLCLHTSS